ncbi:hypothetical protein PIB30_050548 [Stylosanthes scabra]|uniref:Uncharacterized protein n=1 Tax=Stylosanthes scabra TaxID=79078 RepID=A0ABU6YG96_9FABA|nr:hypothetical protein [Stylosanthes scabra]
MLGVQKRRWAFSTPAHVAKRPELPSLYILGCSKRLVGRWQPPTFINNNITIVNNNITTRASPPPLPWEPPRRCPHQWPFGEYRWHPLSHVVPSHGTLGGVIVAGGAVGKEEEGSATTSSSATHPFSPTSSSSTAKKSLHH